MNLNPEDKALIYLWLLIIPIAILLLTIGFIMDANKVDRVVIKCPKNTEKVYLFCK